MASNSTFSLNDKVNIDQQLKEWSKIGIVLGPFTKQYAIDDNLAVRMLFGASNPTDLSDAEFKTLIFLAMVAWILTCALLNMHKQGKYSKHFKLLVRMLGSGRKI